MTTGLDIVTGALRNINAYEAGEPLNSDDANDALAVLNDLLDSLSQDELFVYSSVENIVNWTPGKYQYTIGNPVGGTFTGTLVSGSPVISGVTVPSNLIIGGTVTDYDAQVPAGATIVSFNAGAGTVTLSANALSTVSSLEQFTYTTPGDFAIQRPLKITQAFTRINPGVSGLDYMMDIISEKQWTQIGYKGISGPWPIVLFYQPTFPLGTIFVHQNPAAGNEVHLWCDLILSQLTLSMRVNLPQGYSRALKKLLALELAPEWGKSVSVELRRQAMEARDLIKSQNSIPVPTLNYDSALMSPNRTDAGFILHGGFGR